MKCILLLSLLILTCCTAASPVNVTVKTGHNAFGNINFTDRVGKLSVVLKEHSSNESREFALDDDFHYLPGQEYEYKVDLWVDSLSDLAEYAIINWKPHSPGLQITADFVHFEHGTDRKSYYFDPLEPIFSSQGYQQD